MFWVFFTQKIPSYMHIKGSEYKNDILKMTGINYKGLTASGGPIFCK
jgi:hypothetical protein